MAHSGGIDGVAYSDHTGMMGNPLYSDDVGKMCYNAVSFWFVNDMCYFLIWQSTFSVSLMVEIMCISLSFLCHPMALFHPLLFRPKTGISHGTTIGKSK